VSRVQQSARVFGNFREAKGYCRGHIHQETQRYPHGGDGVTKGALALIVSLLLLLVGAVRIAIFGWRSAEDVALPAYIWVALGAGVFFSLLVGIGVTALLFYSSRLDLVNRRKNETCSRSAVGSHR
jgi:hypothetical protein